jgi:nucleoside-diphosphate-sugar epimerase
MKLLVTGATGFLGRYVVAEALRRGHEVRAILRSAELSEFGWMGHPRLSIVQADLRARAGLTRAVSGVDAVLHLAAAKSGDLYAQYAGTVVATENLLAAMSEAQVGRLVLISSFSVYNYLKIPLFSVVTEESPIEKDAFSRDEYSHTKLVQERIAREHADGTGSRLTVLRPGVIYGKDNFFTARLGVQAGRLLIRTGRWARLPLTYVENCAEAILLAAESESAIGQTLNVIDDDPPTQARYARLLQRRLSPRPVIVPIAWSVMTFLAGMAALINKALLGNHAKVPGLFVQARLQARCKPLRYANEKIRNMLKWKPRYSLTEALERSLGSTTLQLTRVATAATAPNEPAARVSGAGKTEVAA